ncbi:CxC2 domain-containing protein [Mycena indigotica]|uniref:CxC2 domain-containing protein n=1 Tax=Mycena indigotica TaxID=2126181 RepID=A0A8H6S292_9AGAR|nr:CxC2 domain-containing protein [Mycena indigotica]KAF7291343.1 CxC2 domain-containing protein [Mycena indigotica]
MFIAIDACFRLKRRTISNELRDPGLGTGWAYMLEWAPYREYLLTTTDQQEMSTCSGLAALDHANTKFSRGYSVTGVGMGVCARHEFVLPNGVGDLQAGERYANMDYIFASLMRHISPKLFKLVSYDIACQWMKKLVERLERLPPMMHINGHLIICQIIFSLWLLLGSGMTDGEGIERPWSMIGGIAASTRVSGPGTRWDQLDDHWSFWNWQKTLGLATILRRRTDRAKQELEKQEEDFEALTLGHAERVPEWKRQVEAFEADNAQPSPYEATAKGLTESDVRKMYEEEEATQEKAGILPIHDVSPTEFVVALLDAEADQRRIRGLVELKNSRGSIGGVSIRRQRRKLNRMIKRLRTLQATYMPAALQHLESLKVSQDTYAERVPLLCPSAMVGKDFENGGCRAGLLEIEKDFRDAQCRSALTSLQLQLHVKSRLLTYKKNHARAQATNTRSRTLVDKNERKILLHSEKYQASWKALVAILGGEDKVHWRQLHKADIRCMEAPEDALLREQKRLRAEREEEKRKAELRRAGLPDLPRFGLNGLNHMHELRRWREEVRILAAEWERMPLSFGAEEANWAKRGAQVEISRVGAAQAEGLIAYAARHADMYRNLSRRAELVRTEPKLGRGQRRERGVNEVYTTWSGGDADAGSGQRDVEDGLVDPEDADEHGNTSDEEDDED